MTGCEHRLAHKVLNRFYLAHDHLKGGQILEHRESVGFPSLEVRELD